MSHPVSITDLLTAIGSDNIKFQYLTACMEGIKGAKGRNLITFGTDALTPSDVALNTGPSGLIVWVEGDLMRQSLSDIKSGNSLTFGKVVEQHDELLAALETLYRDYVQVMEAGRDRIMYLGGHCDPIDVMERGDPRLIDARKAIAKAKGGAA